MTNILNSILQIIIKIFDNPQITNMLADDILDFFRYIAKVVIKSSEKNKKIEAFNNLPSKIQIQLIARIADNRVFPKNGKTLKEMGYELSFYGYTNFVVLQIDTSNVKPIFIIDYNRESVTLKDGIVLNGYVSVVKLSISKDNLYDDYLKNKELYGDGIAAVIKNDKLIEIYEVTKKTIDKKH